MDEPAFVEDKASNLQVSCITKLAGSTVLASDSEEDIEAAMAPLNVVVAKVCPGNCRGQGSCENATCICESGRPTYLVLVVGLCILTNKISITLLKSYS